MLRGLTTTLLNGVARRNRVSRLANWETSERKGSPVTPRHNAGMGRFTDTKKTAYRIWAAVRQFIQAAKPGRHVGDGGSIQPRDNFLQAVFTHDVTPDEYERQIQQHNLTGNGYALRVPSRRLRG